MKITIGARSHLQGAGRFLASILIFSLVVLPAAPVFALGELPVTPPADTTAPVISGVLQSSVLPTGITIAWTTNELAVSTFVYGLNTSYGSSSSLPTSAAIGGTAVLTGLAPSTTYYYCIHATDTSSNTSQSCSTFVTAVAPDVTGPIVSVVVAVATTTSVTVTWTTSENADAQIQYGTDVNYGSTSNLNSTLGLTHSVEISNLSPNTTYHYRVLSRDAAGNLTTGTDNTFTTSALPTVSVSPTVTDTIPPVITDISSVSLEPHDATIAWTTDELVVSTLTYGTTTNYGSTATLPTTLLLAHTATLLNLDANTTYYYCIHATDLAGNIANSCGHSITTAANEIMLDTNPPTVSLITVNPITTTSATIGWTSDEIAGGYVEYGLNIGYGFETTFDTNLALTHSATLSGLTPATEYHYRVHSRDEAGNAVITPDETFTTASVPSMQTPTDTTPPSITDINTGSIASTLATVNWSTNELAVSTFEYGTTMSCGSSAELSGSGLLVHDATLVGLTPSTTYYYCIHATDLAGNTANSCGHTFITSAPPVVPDTTAPVTSVVLVSSITSSSASIHWTGSEQADSQIQYGTTTNYTMETPIEAESNLSGSATITDLSPNTTYHFRVRLYDSSGNIGRSNDYTFTTGSVSVSGSQTSGTSSNAAPIISGVGADTIGETTATVNWQTDIPADSYVEYGNSENLSSHVSSGTLSTSHALVLTGLTSNTNYYYRVISKPVGGVAYQATSPLHDFNTLAVPVIIDPAANILSVSNTPSGTNASVSFSTDELTMGHVEYGTTTAYGLTQSLSDWNTTHALSLSSFLPGTTYHFRVTAIDSGDNITYSEDHTFTTSGTAPAQNNTETISAPVPQVSSGGGGGGGGSYVYPAPVPNLVTAEGVDSQIVFSWNNPETSGFAGTVIVRKASTYPTSVQDGQAIYNGASETFTDISLNNGSTYYYALYSYNSSNQYSNPIRVSTAPKAGVTEVKIDRNAVEENALPQEHFTEELNLGDTSLEVVHLQQVLNTVNVHQSKLTTGYFGSLTQTALKQFQAKYNLPQTGITDTATRAMLDSISDSWMVVGAPKDIALLQTDLKRGDNKEEVEDLQEFLDFEGSYPEGIISSYFGSLTQKGVKNFQEKYGVTPVSGYVGFKTRHTIQTVLGM